MKPRSGAALIIAISVLAALLFLALPFVFSQSASVAGARAASWDGVARRGSDRASGLGAALSVYVTALHRSSQMGAARLAYVQVPLQINSPDMVNFDCVSDGAHRAVLGTGSSWTTNSLVIPKLDGDHGTHGVILEDESRRIDPNCLGEYAWAQVLARAGIVDPPTLYWSWNPMPGGTSVYAHGRWIQASYGRLARRLALWRPANATRYNRLEDLLGANPDESTAPPPRTAGCIPTWPKSYNRSDGRPYWPPGASEAQIEATRNDAENNIPSDFKDPLQVDFATKILGYRIAALTPAELDRLKTQLTFLVPGQGRSGLIDMATVVAESTGVVENYGVTHDDLSPDDHLEMGPPLRTSTSWATTIQAKIGRQDDNRWQEVDDALAITATPALNINTVPSDSELVRLFSAAADPATEGWPADPVNTPITSIGHLPRLAWLDPRLGNSSSFYDPNIGSSTNRFERPPIGLLGYGTMVIEGAANALDADGRQVGQRRRRTVMQTVPQEHAVQAVWSSQGEIEALLLSRHGSWVQSGPLPTRRITTYGLAKDGTRDIEAMQALDKAGWIEAAPVCSFGTNPSVLSDWWVPFGLTQPTPWEDITKAFTSGQPKQDSTTLPTQTPAKQTAMLSDLRPKADGTPGLMSSQGLHLRAGDRIAWEVGANGPLQATTSGDQLNPRHLSFRFRIDAGASLGSAPVVLMESRASQPGADTQRAYDAGQATAEDGFGEPDVVTDDQFVWRLMYDPTGTGGEQLVLVLANAALPWRDTDRTRFGITATWQHRVDMPDQAEDGRCLPGTLPFAPPWKAQRVEYRYRVNGGLEAGRWYHLQVASGGDQPGHQAVILDGIVGRDAILANAFSETGDHYVFPSLRLGTPTLALATPPALGTVGNTHLTSGNITVLAPPGLTAADVLPSRGVVRIDDEFISYDSISGNILQSTQRGRRQGTDQTAMMNDPADTTAPFDQIADNEYRWPILQGHREGALVVPGWSQIRVRPNAQWLYGAAKLESSIDYPSLGLPELPATGTIGSVVINSVTSIDVTVMPVANPLFGTHGNPAFNFGKRGYVEIYERVSGNYDFRGRAYFERAAGTQILNLDFTPDAPNGVSGTCPSSGDLVAMQVSIEVDQPVKDTGFPRFVAGGGYLQLLDPQNGRIEWLSYSRAIDREAAKGRFFVRFGGFGRDTATAVNPSTLVRGAMRTPWRRHTSDGPWPAGTVVLPVQTRFALTSRLEAGDVITAVPDDMSGGADPTQLVVRYACRDGYPMTAIASGTAHETDNKYFALAHQAPTGMAVYDGQQTLLIGRGWGGDDLSPYGNSPWRRGAMPRLAGLGDSVQKAALHVGCGQESPAYAADYPAPIQVGVMIDDLCAGQLHWRADHNASTASGVIAFETGSELTSAADKLPITITTQGGVFSNCPTYGLVLLDGEVFAYRQMDPPEADRARLIARGLLGSSPANHRITADVTMPTDKSSGTPSRDPVRNALSILPLPMGPVGELASGLNLNDQGTHLDVIEIPHTSYFRDPPAPLFKHREQDVYARTGDQHLDEAPCQLIQDPVDTRRIEVLRLLDYPTQANQRTAAPWLRGLFGSTPQHWQPGFTNFARNRPTVWVDQTPPPNGSGSPIIITLNPQPAADANLNPIIIGWWPRFAPGIPVSLPSNTMHASALLRCRSYAWAGFPLRFYGARFDPAIPALSAEGIADVQVADSGGLQVETRALAAGKGLAELFDWNSSSVGGTGSALKEPFNWSRFDMREVDGAELRVHWVMPTSTTLEGLADAQGRTPRLGNPDSDLGKDPAVGSGIRLRCVAPTRVLAVEEVR